MPIEYINNDTDGVDASLSGGLWILRNGFTLSNSGDAFDFLDTLGNELVVGGSIYSEVDAIDSNSPSSANKVYISPTGVVWGASDGIKMAGDDHRVVNSGEVHGMSSGGIEMTGDFVEVINSGYVYGANSGIYLFSNGSLVTNTGTVTGTDEGIYVDGTDNQIENSGLISGNDIGIAFITATTHSNTLVNSGTIQAANTSSPAILATFGEEAIFNSGEIIGDVKLGGGDDRYEGRLGSISGAVYGEAGSDVLIAGDHGVRLYGGSDNDELYGGAGNDRIDGGAGTDRMEGGAGNDIYVVAAQYDSVVEDFDGGTDRMISYSSRTLAENVEVLELVAGNINGTGNAEDNVIIGTTGNNVLNGKEGADELRGEAGADTFVFDTAPSSVDWLSDFNSADDKIRLDGDIFANINDGGFIASNQLSESGRATSTAHRVIYDPVTGALSYDADGSGATDAVQFAQLDAGLDLVRWDFEMV